jgi:hypothetical protein
MSAPKTLAEFAAGNEAARAILGSGLSSAAAAVQLTELGWPVSAPTVRGYRRHHRQVTDRAPRTFTAGDRAGLHAKLDELLDQADPAAVKSMRLSAWDGMVRNDQGEAEIVRQYGVRLESAPLEPRWPPRHRSGSPCRLRGQCRRSLRAAGTRRR